MSTKFWQRVFSFIVLTGMLVGLAVPGAAQAKTLPVASAAQVVQQEDPLPKIEQQVLDEITAKGKTDFFITLKDKADLSPASKLNTKDQKGEFVFNTLRATADRTQKDLRAYLDKQGAKYTSYYIANAILVSGGSQDLLISVASRSDVAGVIANHKIQLEKPFVEPAGPEGPNAVEPNLTFVKAPDVWAMGITGVGIVLAGNDTGLSWVEPTIINHYRGWNGTTADHNYNWWDATGANPNEPFDGYGHGTHTTGTMIGDDGGTNQIGMAPGAKTIHCRNMDAGGGGIDAWFLTCFEWDLAPWDLSGSNPRPDLAPDAINNSWGYWGGNNPIFIDSIDALQAAGILVEVSAGNEGPACSTLRSPGDYAQVLTTGSVDHIGQTFPGIITNSSWSPSRGPSALFPGDFFPDVMAPGNGIRSALPGGTYASWGGTSMAGPHVTGLIALLWSANPALRGLVDVTAQIIVDTAAPLTGQPGSSCGGDYTDGPNNDWGYGTIDSLAAVQMAIAFGGVGTLAGHVTDASANPLSNVTIQASLSLTQSFQTTTNLTGDYTMSVYSGTYTVEASKYGYLPQTVNNVVVLEDQTTTQNFSLVQAPSSDIGVTVVDANTGWPLYAQSSLGGTPFEPVWTNPVTGRFVVTIPNGVELTLGVDAWTPGYLHQDYTFTVNGDQEITIDLEPDVAACNAPGYEFAATNFLSEDFEATNGGFTVSGTNASWQWGTPVYGPGDAHSGVNAWGTGLTTGLYNDNEDSFITSPVIDLSSQAGKAVVVDWWQYLNTESCCDYGEVQVTNNGGSSWTTIWGPAYGAVDLDWTEHFATLDPSYAVSNFQIRFHLYTDYSVTYAGFYVDDVSVDVGQCTPMAGGLVVGNVFDTNEGLPLPGSLVSNDSGFSTVTVATVDPNVDDAFYVLFSPGGVHDFTASHDGFTTVTEPVTVAPNDTIEHNFYLPAGHLVFDPLNMHVTLDMGANATLPLTITNNGDGAATFAISEIDKGFTPMLKAAHTVTIPATSAVPPANTSVAANPGYTSRPEMTINIPAAPAEGENVFIVCADDNPCEPLASQLAAFGDLGTIATYDARNGTPTLAELQAYDVVLTWGNYDYANSTAMGDVLADYVDAGGKVINMQFALSGPYGKLNGRFLTDNYTAMTATGLSYNTSCLGNFDPTHPIMAGITDVCDSYRAFGTALTPGSTAIASWTDNELFVAVKDDRSVVTINLYPGTYYLYTGQAPDVIHNAVLWIAGGGDIPWLTENPITGTIPGTGLLASERLVANTTGATQANPGIALSSQSKTIGVIPEAPANPAAVLWDQPLSAVTQAAYVNQEFPDFPTFSTFLADDFINAEPWAIDTIFVPGDGFGGFSTVMNASALHWAIYADAGGVPAGDPSGGGAAPVWSFTLPPTDPQVVVTNGTPGGFPSNVTLNLAAPINLPAGHYWFVFYPTMTFGSFGQLGRQPSDTTNGYTGQAINPGGGFGFGTAWQNWMTWPGALLPDMAFRLEGTVGAAGNFAVVNVTFDAGVPEVTQPGDYFGQMRISSNTPYPPTTIPVTMTVTPPDTFGKLEGTISGLGHCDLDHYAIEGASVFVQGSTGMTWTLETDANGYYQVWMDQLNTPVTIHVTAPGHVGQDRSGVVIVGTQTTTEDFDLRWDQPCVTETPDKMEVTVLMGNVTTTQMTLANTGAAASNFELREVDKGYSPTALKYQAPAKSAGSAAQLTQYGQAEPSGKAAPLAPKADILLDQPPNQVNGLFADADCGACGTGQQSIAENFALPNGADIGQIVFWTGYFPGDIPQDPDAISVLFHQDAGGYPGAVVYSEDNVAYERAQTGVVIFGVHEWIHILTLDSPVSLAPGIYWVEIFNHTTGNSDQFFWETGDMDPVYGLPGSAWTTATPGTTWNYDPSTDLSIQLLTAEVDVPWLSENPATGTLAPDTGVQDVAVTFDASAVPQPGKYFAILKVKNDDPVNGSISVPVTMTVAPTPAYGILTGNVTGLGYCDTNPAPLEDAVVLIEAANGVTYTVVTDAEGNYSRWLKAADGPYIVSASADSHEYGLVSDVVITSLGTTNVDFDLRWLKPCVSAAPSSLVVDVPLGTDKTVTLDLLNNGAVSSPFKLSEKEGTPVLKSVGKGDGKFSAPAPIGPLSVRSPEGRANLTSQPNLPSAWTSGADMPTGVVRFAKAQCADQPDSFYVISGVDNTYTVNPQFSRYDADSDTWTSLAPFPAPAEGPNAVCYEGFVYVVGGGGTNQFYIYDIAADSWAAGPAFPRSVWGAAVGVWDGMIFVAGGDSDFYFGGTSNEVDIYDIATGAWTGTGSPMPTPRSTPLQVQAGQYLYVVGGWGDSAPATNSNATERYDMASDTWEVGPTFDPALADGAMAVTQQFVYAIGGDANGGGAFDATSTVYALDFAEWPGGAWTDIGDPLPVALTANNGGFCTQAVAGGEVWNTGGGDSSLLIQTANDYRPAEPCFSGAADVPWLAEAPITGTIGHDSSFPVDVTFTAFPTLTVGGTYTATLNVKSDDPVNGRLAVPVTMNVVEPVFGVAVSADQTGSGEPGTVVIYTVTVTNTSNFSVDSFDVTLGTHAYTTTLSTAVVGPLAVGESATFVVTVHIPSTALDGDHDSVQITVTSASDPTKTAIVNVTTDVFVIIIPPTNFPVYLPLMSRQP